MSGAPGAATRRARRGDAPQLPLAPAIVAVVGVLAVVGLVMVLSASSVTAERQHGSTWTYFGRQALWVTLGAAAMTVTARVDYRRWRRLAGPGVLVTVALLVLVLVPGVGVEVDGGQRWLGAGPLTVQPGELAKLAVLLFAADLLARRCDHVTDDRRTLRPVLSVLVVLAALLMLQPDLGTTLVVGAIGIGLLTLAGVPLRRIGVVTAVAGAATLVLALRADYRRQRLLAFLDPSADPLGTGYQINQSLTGLASGGLLGVGLGASRAKWGFLPNAHTDFIYTVIGEELGLVGALAVIVLFVAFAFLAVAAARRAPDRFGMLLAGGVATWVSVQAFVNIGGCVGALPVTGLPLPFISFGGSAMVAVMAATGVLVNVARQGRPA